MQDRFGVFVYKKGKYGAAEDEYIVEYTEFFEKREYAVHYAEILWRQDTLRWQTRHYIEVWEKDEEGLYGNYGEPVLHLELEEKLMPPSGRVIPPGARNPRRNYIEESIKTIAEIRRKKKQLEHQYKQEVIKHGYHENMGDKYLNRFENYIGDFYSYPYFDRHKIQQMQDELFNVVTTTI